MFRRFIAPYGFDLVGPHEASYPVLTAWLTDFAKIEKNTRRAVDLAAGLIRIADQLQ